jgi:hypothetical protein
MDGQGLCEDCHVLVAAGPNREPHTALTVRKESDDKRLFQCAVCDCCWSLGSLGWSRLIPRPRVLSVTPKRQPQTVG